MPEAETTDANALVHTLSHALWVWDIAELELGELAIVAGRTEGMITKVAEWRSGGRVLVLARGTADGSADRAIETLDPTDQPATLKRLHAAVAASPGAAAVICDESAAVLELVLDAMPVWGRVVLATETSQQATIDFYNNVHRKGARVLSAPATPAQMNEEPWRCQAAMHVERAVRLLKSRPTLASPGT
jgi:hypothetical protein